MDPICRFWSKVNKTTTCWLWTATTTKDGYGKWSIRNNKTVKTFHAHRWIYEQINGKVSDNLVLDHTCRTRSCVRPNHLRVVTKKQNVLENSLSIQAKNSRKTHCPRGHSYSGKNLYVAKNGRRHCNECRRIRQRK